MLSNYVRPIPLRHTLTALLVSILLYGCGQPTDPQSRIERAIEYHANENYRSAMIELKNVLQEDPSNSQARLELGKLYIATGQSAAAEKELRRAQQLGIPAREVVIFLGRAMMRQHAYQRLLDEIHGEPFSADELKANIYLLRGNAFFGIGKYAEAEDAFQHALKINNAAAVEALVGLTRIELKKNDMDAAEKLISRALDINPMDSSAWLTKGYVEKQQGKYSKAEEAFAEAVENAGTRRRVSAVLFSARAGLVQAQISQGKTEEASKNVDWLLRVAPKHPVPKYYKALLAYGSGQFDVAAIQLQELLNIDRDNKPALKLMGVVSFVQGNLEQADMYLSAFVSSVSDDLSARKLLATTRLQLQQPEYAIEALEPAITQEESDSEMLALFSEAEMKSGHYDAGIDYLERAYEANPDSRVLQAELVSSYIRAREVGKAVELLERTPADDSNGDDYRRDLLVILAYMQGKDIGSALRRAEAMEEKRPDDPEIQNLLGGIMAAMRHKRQALAHLKKAVDLRPNYQEAWLNLGRLAIGQGRLDEARSHYRRVLEINPDNVAAMMSLAQLADNAGEQKEAIQWLYKVKDMDPGAVDARLVLVRYFLARRDFQRAREIAEETFAVAAKRPDVLNALGVTQMWTREQRKAVATLKKAAEIAPESVSVIYNLARAQLSINETHAAQKNLQKVLRLAPDNIVAATMLAALELREGNAENALALAKQQQQQVKSDPAGYVLEGDLHLRQGDFSDAVRAYRTAWNLARNRMIAMKLYVALRRADTREPYEPLREWVEENPDDFRIRVVLANAYQAEGRLKKAIVQYEAALKLDPENPVILNNLAWSYFLDKDSRAIQLAEKAHKILPDRGDVADTYGWLLVDKGEVRRGVEILQKAVEQAPDVTMIRYHLAVALARSGAREAARRELDKVLQSDSGFQNLPEIEEVLNNTP